MRILVASNSYPTKKNPTRQVFVKNIFENLKAKSVNTDLVYNFWFRFFKSDFKTGDAITSVGKVIMMAISYFPYFFFKAKKYDIIYSQAAILPGIFVAVSKKFTGVKHVCFTHGSENTYVKKRGFTYKIAKYTLRSSDLVLANSRYMKDRLKKDYGCESVVISPGYNKDVFFYKQTPKRIDLFFAGHAVAQKGVDVLLMALSEYHEFYRRENLSVRMHFSGSETSKYLRFAEKHKITEFATFGDRLEEADLVKFYRESKIVVLPSRDEALGLVGIEAIACGAFLIASDSGGIREYVSNGENGYLFEKGNHHDLHKKIIAALENYPAFQAKQPELSTSVAEYSISKSIDRTLELFGQIVD